MGAVPTLTPSLAHLGLQQQQQQRAEASRHPSAGAGSWLCSLVDKWAHSHFKGTFLFPSSVQEPFESSF